MAFYDRENKKDTGDKDHVLFLTGQKKEMTDYLLERLDAMKTDAEKNRLSDKNNKRR
jgi:hypothetical protein